MERTLHPLQQTLDVVKVNPGMCVESPGAHYKRLWGEAVLRRADGSLENLVNHFLKGTSPFLGSLPELVHQVVLNGQRDSFRHVKILGSGRRVSQAAGEDSLTTR